MAFLNATVPQCCPQPFTSREPNGGECVTSTSTEPWLQRSTNVSTNSSILGASVLKAHSGPIQGTYGNPVHLNPPTSTTLSTRLNALIPITFRSGTGSKKS